MVVDYAQKLRTGNRVGLHYSRFAESGCRIPQQLDGFGEPKNFFRGRIREVGLEAQFERAVAALSQLLAGVPRPFADVGGHLMAKQQAHAPGSVGLAIAEGVLEEAFRVERHRAREVLPSRALTLCESNTLARHRPEGQPSTQRVECSKSSAAFPPNCTRNSETPPGWPERAHRLRTCTRTLSLPGERAALEPCF